jgi:hypothetical protein
MKMIVVVFIQELGILKQDGTSPCLRISPMTLGFSLAISGFRISSQPPNLQRKKIRCRESKKKTKHTAAYLNEPNYHHQLIN